MAMKMRARRMSKLMHVSAMTLSLVQELNQSRTSICLNAFMQVFLVASSACLLVAILEVATSLSDLVPTGIWVSKIRIAKCE